MGPPVIWVLGIKALSMPFVVILHMLILILQFDYFYFILITYINKVKSKY